MPSFAKETLEKKSIKTIYRAPSKRQNQRKQLDHYWQRDSN